MSDIATSSKQTRLDIDPGRGADGDDASSPGGARSSASAIDLEDDGVGSSEGGLNTAEDKEPTLTESSSAANKKDKVSGPSREVQGETPASESMDADTGTLAGDVGRGESAVDDSVDESSAVGPPSSGTQSADNEKDPQRSATNDSEEALGAKRDDGAEKDGASTPSAIAESTKVKEIDESGEVAISAVPPAVSQPPLIAAEDSNDVNAMPLPTSSDPVVTETRSTTMSGNGIDQTTVGPEASLIHEVADSPEGKGALKSNSLTDHTLDKDAVPFTQEDTELRDIEDTPSQKEATSLAEEEVGSKDEEATKSETVNTGGSSQTAVEKESTDASAEKSRAEDAVTLPQFVSDQREMEETTTEKEVNSSVEAGVGIKDDALNDGSKDENKQSAVVDESTEACTEKSIVGDSVALAQDDSQQHEMESTNIQKEAASPVEVEVVTNDDESNRVETLNVEESKENVVREESTEAKAGISPVLLEGEHNSVPSNAASEPTGGASIEVAESGVASAEASNESHHKEGHHRHHHGGMAAVKAAVRFPKMLIQKGVVKPAKKVGHAITGHHNDDAAAKSSAGKVETKPLAGVATKGNQDKSAAETNIPLDDLCVFSSYLCSYHRKKGRLPVEGKIFLTAAELRFVPLVGTKFSLNWTELSLERTPAKPFTVPNGLTLRRDTTEDAVDDLEGEKHEAKEEYLFTFFGSLREDAYGKMKWLIDGAKSDLREREEAKKLAAEDAKGDDDEVVNEEPQDPILEKMQIIVNKKLQSVSIKTFYEMVWSEATKPLYGPWLEGCGKSDVEVGKWEHGLFKNDWCEQEYTQRRVVTYNFQAGTTHPEVTQTHYCRIEGTDEVVLANNITMLGVPFCDSFDIQQRWVAQTRSGRNDADEVEDLSVRCGLFVNFKKPCGSFAEKQITTNITKERSVGQRDFFEWMRHACTDISVPDETLRARDDDEATSNITSDRSTLTSDTSSTKESFLMLLSMIVSVVLFIDRLIGKLVSPERPWVPQGETEQSICAASKKLEKVVDSICRQHEAGALQHEKDGICSRMTTEERESLNLAVTDANKSLDCILGELQK